MSIMQRLTLIGLYNYDSTLFDGLTLPEAYDKNTFIESLMIEHGEKLVLYSDYDFMKYSIGAWGRKWNLELERIAEALKAEYNPIWNYDRYEEVNDVNNRSHDLKSIRDGDTTSETSGNGNTTSTTNISNDSTSNVNTSTNTSNDSASASNNTKKSETQTDNTTNHNLTNNADFDIVKENITNGEVEHQISADNESTYQPQSKDITNIGKQKETTDGIKDDIEENTSSHENAELKEEESASATEHSEGVNNSEENAAESSNGSSVTNENNNSGSSTTSHDEGSTNTSEDENFASNHNAHLWGNIGVTTSAAMVTEVIEQRMKYNLYNVACRLFANELLIGIY